jgi:hypothetical protein
MSSNDEIRLSQLIQTFGPGAIIDLPDHSAMIMGLDSWPIAFGNQSMRQIKEPRLVNYLTKLLNNAEDGESWLAPGVTLSLYEPPLNGDIPAGRQTPAVPAVKYPRWEVISDPSDLSKQELRRFRSGEKPKGKKGQTISPVRWVAACSKGHIDDIDWRYFVHQGQNCQQTMYMKDEGAAGDPQYITVMCDCGANRKLSELFTENALGTCKGYRPWIEGYTATVCSESQRPMTRGAINNYYSQILKLIALPADQNEVEQKVLDHLSAFDNVKSLEEALHPIQYGQGPIKNSFEGIGQSDIWAALQKIRSDQVSSDSNDMENPKVEEYSILASGKKLIGQNSLGARLHAETLEDMDWRDQDEFDTSFIQSQVRVHRLCEVTCLYGFTRIEPAPSPFDEIQEDITLEVKGQSLAEKVTWLPAMEQFGEGLFLKFDIDEVRKRIKALGEDNSLVKLKQRYDDWYQKDTNRRRPFPGNEYVFAHSLSHLLIEQISLEAGYPSTALSERIYVLKPEGSGQISKLGLLIYAAGGGSQGTLGGLLDQATNLPATLKRGIRRHLVCGNDPICSNESALLTSDIDMINGAACHGCLFTAETSCERRNTLLDRISLLEILG